jgi:hypothetical protein
VIVKGHSYNVIDIDTSPMDNSKSHKEGVSWTYKCFDGFQPMFFYIGGEGYILEAELRPGSHHCQRGTPEMIINVIAKLKRLYGKKRFLFRLDSGNDSKDTIKAILHNGEEGAHTGHFLLIKRNKRQENDETWLSYAKRYGHPVQERKGKTVWTGDALVHPEGKEFPDKDLHIVYEITERTIDRYGNELLIPEIEVQSWWTNLAELPETVIELYHSHATMEQYHSEMKTDMNVERLPSKSFTVNKIIFATAILAYNTLRLIGQTALKSKLYPCKKEKPLRKRLGKVISDIISIAGKFVRHSRKKVYRVSIHNPWQPVFMSLVSFFIRW